MSIVRIFKVTDSRWKKSSWATRIVCLCHSISSPVAFSQMMQKLLPQLQHPHFFPSPSSPGPATDQSQPFLLAESLEDAPSRDNSRRAAGGCWLERQLNIAILRPGPAVHRPPSRPVPAGEPRCGLGRRARGWRTLLLPAQLLAACSPLKMARMGG